MGQGHSNSAEADGREAIAKIIRTKPRDEWTEIFSTIDVCVEPILSPEEVIESELHKSRERFFTLSGIQHTRTPLTPERDHTPAPGLGEHTESVLAAAGVGDFASLRSDGVIA